MWPWLRHYRSAVLCRCWWRLQAGDNVLVCGTRCRRFRHGPGSNQSQVKHLRVHHSPHLAAALGAPPFVPPVTVELRASHHNVASNPRAYSSTPDAFPATRTPTPSASTAAPTPTRASSRSQLRCRCTIIMGNWQEGLVLFASPHRVSYHPGTPTSATSDREASTSAASVRQASTTTAGGSACDDLVPV